MPHKAPTLSSEMPNSAKRAIERSNQSRPYTINRTKHGTRPMNSNKPRK